MIPPEAFTTPSAVGRLLGFSFQQLCISVYLARGRGNRTYLNVYRVIEIRTQHSNSKQTQYPTHIYRVYTDPVRFEYQFGNGYKMQCEPYQTVLGLPN